MENSIYVKIAADTLTELLKTGKTVNTEKKYEGELSEKKACFITIKSSKRKLRGCIGTLSPMYANLKTEIIRNAVAAATRDSRFKPLAMNELDDIVISVEVLDTPGEIFDKNRISPKEYGLILEDEETGKRGVLLPDIEGVDTADEQVSIVKRKAGIYQTGLEGLRMFLFKTKKYK